MRIVKLHIVKEIILQIKYKEYETIASLPTQDNQLIMKAREAAQNGYAPYSKFRVGAAVLLENGVIITGNNQENAAYPSGLCAERTALFYAGAQFPKVPIVTIAVSTLTHVLSGIAKPCGACRQVIAEYEDIAGKPIHIILDSADKILVIDGIDGLLPLRFRKDDLS